MKSFAAIVTAVLAASALVSAAPHELERRAGTGKTKNMSKSTRLDAAGAVYCNLFVSVLLAM